MLELLSDPDRLLDQHDHYNLGHGFRLRRNRTTARKWVVFYSHWELDYLLATQAKKPRPQTARVSLKFETVTEAVRYAESVIACPESMKLLEEFMAKEATACSDRRLA